MNVGFFGGKFLPLHKGHMYAINQALQQVTRLYVVLSSGENYDKTICKIAGIKYMPPEERLNWLGEELAKSPIRYKIIHIEDRPFDNEHDWEYGAQLIKQQIPEKITHVFSSEPEYTEKFSALYPGTKHVLLDETRRTYPISSTMIRDNLFDNWDFLTPGAKRFLSKKVAIVGTESCGKSTLAERLAKHFVTEYVHELGRDYCDKYSNQLTVDSFDDIAMQHWLEQRKLAGKANKVLFVDSDAIATQYFLDMYFTGAYSPVVESIVSLQDYDLVMYLEPDVPWIDDGLRFAGDDDVRKANNIKLKGMYHDRGIDLHCICGNYEKRFSQAVQMINALLRG